MTTLFQTGCVGYCRAALRLLVPLALIFCGAVSASANLYFYEPLMQVPAPEEVFAFASDPPLPRSQQETPLSSDRQMSRKDLLLFLREGAVDPCNAAPRPADDPVFTPKNDGEIGCRGVFFNKKGAAYFWALCDTQTLFVVTTDYHACYLRLKQPRVRSHAVLRGPDEFHPFQPPAAKDVLWFANTDRPGTGFQLFRSKDYILRFLQQGKALHYSNYFERFQISHPARVTLPDSLVKRYQQFGITLEDKRVDPLESDLEIAGVFVTKDAQVYFWEQWGDDVIKISDTTGAECAMKLPATTKTPAHASPKATPVPAK